MRPTDFEAHKRYPTESQLTSYVRQLSTVCVISTFGLFGGLLHKKSIRPDGLIKSPTFEPLQRLLKTIVLNLEAEENNFLNCSGKTPPNCTD